jgi:hypothetical protein
MRISTNNYIIKANDFNLFVIFFYGEWPKFDTMILTSTTKLFNSVTWPIDPFHQTPAIKQVVKKEYKPRQWFTITIR